MKTFRAFVLLSILGSEFGAVAFAASATTAAKLATAVYNREDMKVTPMPNGEHLDVFEGPTAAVDRLHCHITKLNPGVVNGSPSHHLHDEIIVVNEGTLEVHYDGKVQIARPGAVIFFAIDVTMFLRNIGDTPAVYTVLNYDPSLPPKS